MSHAGLTLRAKGCEAKNLLTFGRNNGQWRRRIFLSERVSGCTIFGLHTPQYVLWNQSSITNLPRANMNVGNVIRIVGSGRPYGNHGKSSHVLVASLWIYIDFTVRPQICQFWVHRK